MEESSAKLETVTVTAYGILGKYDTLAGGCYNISRTTTHVLPVPEYATHLQQARVFPNPFTAYLNIDFKATSPGTLQADLYAPDGTTLHHWQPKAFKAGGNTLRFDFMDNRKLIPGHYFLRLEDGDGRVGPRVIIKG